MKVVVTEAANGWVLRVMDWGRHMSPLKEPYGADQRLFVFGSLADLNDWIKKTTSRGT